MLTTNHEKLQQSMMSFEKHHSNLFKKEIVTNCYNTLIQGAT